MKNDAIEIELGEIELMLADASLGSDCRYALQGAAQALRWILEPDEWASPTQTYYPGRRGPQPDPESGAIH